MPIAYGMVAGMKHGDNVPVGGATKGRLETAPAKRNRLDKFKRKPPKASSGKARAPESGDRGARERIEPKMAACQSCGRLIEVHALSEGVCRECGRLQCLPIMARRLRIAEREAGVTAKQAAERAGVNYSSYLKYREGIAEMTAGRVPSICRALGVTADWLLGMDA